MKKESKTEKKQNFEIIIKEIFKLFDQYVWLNDWIWLERDFAKLGKEYDFDPHLIYFGETSKEMKKKYQRYKPVIEIEAKENKPFAASETDILFHRYCKLNDKEKKELEKRIEKHKKKK